MIFHDGWYYLLATHGSCCAGANSSYNIRVGRSREVTGPFIDNMGIDMLQGGGKLLIGASDRVVGPGHFGLIDLGDGVQKFSCHFEADLDRGGQSVLGIRPLLWENGWPVSGENVREGTYRLESARTGTALELAVEGVPVGGGRGGQRRGAGGAGRGQRRGGGRGRGGGAPIPDQDVQEVAADWPEDELGIRMAVYMLQAQQKWEIAPAPDAGGYLGSPYYRISIAGTGYSLAATADHELTALPEFIGGDEQLWRIDQLADGSYRIMPKAIPGYDQPLALSAVGSSFATLSKYDPNSDKHRWNIVAP
jgi:arabinan endo-1,5-alpha-L-arabinosidase